MSQRDSPFDSLTSVSQGDSPLDSFAGAVLPLMSVLVILPAGAVAGAPAEPVKVAHTFAIFDPFSAGDKVIKNSSLFVEEICIFFETNEVACSCVSSGETVSVRFSALTAAFAAFPEAVFLICLLVKGFVVNSEHDLIELSADEAAIAESCSFFIYRASQSVIIVKPDSLHNSSVPFHKCLADSFDHCDLFSV